MMMLLNACVNCTEVVDERYRVNERGDVFCGDDCYEDYLDDTCNDSLHPYIDDYEMKRSNYLDWLENWESDIVSVSKRNYLLKIDEMLDAIDNVYVSYWDYYKTEGDDGVFAREIYFYLLKFEDLQNSIFQWRPTRKVSYYLSFQVNNEEADKEIVTWNELSEFIQKMKANTLYKNLKAHIYSPNKLSFLFATKEELTVVLKKLTRKFKSNVNKVQIGNAYVCDGDCSKTTYIMETQAVNQNGWFFCECCDQRLYPGVFPKEELIKEIKFNDSWKNLKKQSKSASWPYYLRKLKRSCRHHGVGYPDWIGLN